jgi:hypothetical protein
MKTQVNLLFYLKKRATYKSGTVTIYLRFTVESQRTAVSTGKTYDPARWNVQAGRVNRTKEVVRPPCSHHIPLLVSLYIHFEPYFTNIFKISAQTNLLITANLQYIAII